MTPILALKIGSFQEREELYQYLKICVVIIRVHIHVSVSAHFRFTVVVSLWPSLHKNWKKRWSLESPATMTFTSRSGATGTTGTTVAATGAATVAATGIVLPSVSVLGLRQVLVGFGIAIISSWAEFGVLVRSPNSSPQQWKNMFLIYGVRIQQISAKFSTNLNLFGFINCSF